MTSKEYIEAYTKRCSNAIAQAGDIGNFESGAFEVVYQPWLTPENALAAVEIAREEELEYIKYQLELRLPETLDYNGVQVDREDFINDFIKAIKDE